MTKTCSTCHNGCPVRHRPELATATIAGSKAKLALDIPTIHGSCLLRIAGKKKTSLNLVSFRRTFRCPEVFWAYLRIGCYDLSGHVHFKRSAAQISSLKPLGLYFLIVPWPEQQLRRSSHAARLRPAASAKSPPVDGSFSQADGIFIVGIFVTCGNFASTNWRQDSR